MARKTTATPRSETAANDRALLRDWLQGIMSRNRVQPKDLAAAGDVDTATVYRWMDPTATTSPRLVNVLRISRYFGEAAPGLAGGFAEPEIAKFEGEPPAALTPATANQSVWRIGNRALELAGVLPGDLVLLDQAAPPRPGDIVIAQIYDFEAGAAETKIRVYDGRSLVTRSMDPSAQDRAMPVDGERAVIAGRIVALHRRLD